jgi:LuxR family maltose regulon positive regulatory protein
VEAISDRRFIAPFLPPRYLSRPRLLADLDRAASPALTVLSAGAGAGKTLLLAEWVHRQDTRVPWLALTAADDDPRRFWRLFLEAVHATGQIGLPPASSYTDVVDLLDLVFQECDEPPQRSVLVLDDAHLLTRPEILHGLDRIVRRWSHRLRLLVAARSDPLLPLHRYRLAAQMHELRAADLAMTSGEAGQLLRLHGVRLADEQVRTLTARTEGWSAGLRLAALRMEHLERPGEFVALLAMDEGSIGEYLTEEVLAVLPQHVQRLLVETSFLDDVTGPLAGAVTGIDNCHDLLVDLVRTNSFVLPADPGRTTFRYHQLFREMLLQLARGQPVAARQRQRGRAARWYQGEGDLLNALRWSVAADDPELARSVLARGGLAQIYVARYDDHAAPLRKLAGQVAPADPAPGRAAEYDLTQRAIRAVLAGPGAGGAAEMPARYPGTPAGDPALTLTVALTELLLQEKAGRYAELADTARQLLADPGLRVAIDEVPGLRASVLLVYAQTLFATGRLGDQGEVLAEALSAAREAKLPRLEAEALAVLAYAEVCGCRFRHARSTISRAEALLTGHPDVARPVLLDLAIARRAYISADFVVMAAVLRRVTAAGTGYPGVGQAAAVAFLQARLLVALGEYGPARWLLCDDPAVARAATGPFGVIRDRELAMIEIAQGRPRSALQLLRRHRGDAAMPAAEITVARAHLALGDLDRAAAAVRAVTTTPSPFVDRPLTVAAALCDAEIAERRGDEGRAAEALDRALLIAGDDIVLPFVQASEALEQVLVRHGGLAARWPAAARGHHRRPELPLPRRDQLPDGLTHREEAVLRLMTTSMSTAEIADELCLSVNTIKTHLAAIYRKLSVSRRREAVFRARELELI